MKANITITTLNINGYMAPISSMSGIEKWSSINCTINENRIVILALQETHLDQNLLHEVCACFGRRLEVVISQHPDNPQATTGVAFVINKALIKPSDYKMYELMPGCAATLKVKWLKNEEMLLVHSDVHGPVKVPTHQGYHYWCWISNLS